MASPPNLLNTPAQYTEQIQTLISQYPSILADFIPAYINYYTYPDDSTSTYLPIYTGLISQLQTATTSLYSTVQNIQTDITSENNYTSSLNTSLQTNTNENQTLTTSLSQLKGTNNGSEVLFTDTHTMYVTKYMFNILIIIGIIILLILMYKLFFTGNVVQSFSKLTVARPVATPTSRYGGTRAPTSY